MMLHFTFEPSVSVHGQAKEDHPMRMLAPYIFGIGAAAVIAHAAVAYIVPFLEKSAALFPG